MNSKVNPHIDKSRLLLVGCYVLLLEDYGGAHTSYLWQNFGLHWLIWLKNWLSHLHSPK